MSPLTSFSSDNAGSPKWSPDGQFIVFDARPEGNVDIQHAVSSGGGAVKRLTNDPAEDHVPFWSKDNWIYFGSSRAGGSQVFRMRPDGSAAQQVTHNGGFYGEVSPDGKWLYYSVPAKGLWKMPPDGGAAAQVLSPPLLYTQFSFVLAAGGIYAIAARRTEGFPIVLYPFDGGAPRTVTSLNHAPFLFPGVSPDGHWFLYSNADDPIYEIMQVDNFR